MESGKLYDLGWAPEFHETLAIHYVYVSQGRCWPLDTFDINVSHSKNDARIYKLHMEVSHATQASLGLSMPDYFAYLQCRWEELAHYETLDDFDEKHAQLVMDRLERHHTYQFLMGGK